MNLSIEEIYRSEKKTIGKVEALLNSFRQDIDIEDEKFYNIIIAVTEAVNNAIIHGHEYDSDKSIIVNVNISDNDISVTVVDEGKGFDPDKVEDPRKPENLFKTNGRGVFLIRSLTDEMTFKKTKRGNEMTMLFNFK